MTDVFLAGVARGRFLGSQLPSGAGFFPPAQCSERVAAVPVNVRLAGVFRPARGEVRRLFERAVERGQCRRETSRPEMLVAQREVGFLEQIMRLSGAFPDGDADRASKRAVAA